MAAAAYDLILVGTGFGSSFFLHEYLRHAGPETRILVLERGARRSHAWRLEHPDALDREARESFDNLTPHKPWVFATAFGGGSNCWWACAPRMLPADFELRTRYGVGRDWPLSYAALEPFYCEAEELMQVAGPSDDSPFERSRPYPQPPHAMSEVDELLKQAFPESFFVQPAARPTRAAPGRPPCCNNGVCHLCPIDSKFTVENGMAGPYADARVELQLEAAVQAVETHAGRAAGVVYRRGERELQARGELVALGANGLFNPHILLRSGLPEGDVGRGLVEQASAEFQVELEGGFRRLGSTSITGQGYLFYDGAHRAKRAAALVETWSIPLFGFAPGRSAQRIKLKYIVEDLPRPENRVGISAADPSRPEVAFGAHSEYARSALADARRDLDALLAPLPVAGVLGPSETRTESHILGTTVMGSDPATSAVDADLVHHRLRNLVVLGSSVFPSAAPANPTLTLAALSLRSARRLVGS